MGGGEAVQACRHSVRSLGFPAPRAGRRAQISLHVLAFALQTRAPQEAVRRRAAKEGMC